MVAVVRVGFPGWEPHPDVWLIVGLCAAAYLVAVRRVGPRLVQAGEPVVRRRHVVCFTLAMLVIWIASDYPVHDLAERYLFSAHMVQHLLYSTFAAPLLIFACPPWLFRTVLQRTHTLWLVQRLTRFLPAVLLFNVVLVGTHIPAMVSLSLRNGLVHFLVHCVILGSGVVLWMPILSPIPEVPRFQPPVQMAYLFLQSVLPTVPAAFLTMGERTPYRDYEKFDRLWGISVRSDQVVAGLVMKTGAGLILWTVIAIVFFRWFAAEESPMRDRRRTSPPNPVDIDRDLLRLPPS